MFPHKVFIFIFIEEGSIWEPMFPQLAKLDNHATLSTEISVVAKNTATIFGVECVKIVVAVVTTTMMAVAVNEPGDVTVVGDETSTITMDTCDLDHLRGLR